MNATSMGSSAGQGSSGSTYVLKLSKNQDAGGGGKKDTGSKVSVLRALIGGQITGKGCKSIRQLPKAVYCRLQSKSHNMAPLCMDLESGLVANHVESCQRVLSNLAHSICEWSSPPQELNREAFVLFGGDTLLLRALFCPFSSQDNVEKSGSSKVLSVRKDCLSILRELCFTVPFFTESLAGNRDFIIKLFALMGNNITFDHAVGLAEEVLAAREATLKVQDIPDFANLVRHFSSRQLASFCRVLAMVAFEPEAGNTWMGQAENNTQLPKSRPEEPEWTVSDKNHDAILLIPDILARLVKLLTFDRVSFSREGSEVSELAASMSMEGTLESMFHAFSESRGQILEEYRSISESRGQILEEYRSISESRGQMLEEYRSISSLLEGRDGVDATLHTHHQRGVSVSLMDEEMLDWNMAFLDRTGPTPGVVHLATHHVEVLFVLCALCGGKKREQVQNSLAELGLVAVLNDMFDKLDWSVSQSRANARGIHGLGCHCNPKSALKIQYLRLIHNFCDRDSCNRANKQLLLSPHISKDGNAVWNKDAEYKESDGLMVKILKILVNEPAESLYRFWLASCVEAFLRGADGKDQEFVASTGLMEHLINEILKGGFRCATSLQINFDLLGELIKFNKNLFQRLNRFLAGAKFDQFVEVLVTNLVDSNVFVRSVVLSLDYFKRSSHDELLGLNQNPSVTSTGKQSSMSSDSYKFGSIPNFLNKEDNEFCKITAFISHNTLRLLRDLMCAVQLSDINQDNICVLNTALIFFIFAERNNELQTYLQALRAADVKVLGTFRSLLEFWRSYYLRKRGRERVSLQYSTQLPFSNWLRIVDSLCSHPDSPYSLLHSPPTAVQCVALAASSEPPPRRC